MKRDSTTATTMVVAAVATTAVLLWAKSRKSKLTKKAETPPFEGVPMAPGAHWLFGHMVLLNSNGFIAGYQRVYVDHADENGLCSFWFVSKPSLSVLLGKDAKAILSSSSFRKPLKLLEVHNDNFLGPKALTALMGKEWRLYRSAVHKSFTPGALQQSQQAINEVGNTLARALLSAIDKSKNSVIQEEVLPLMKMATIDVFGLAAMGLDFECCANLELSPVAEAFEFLTSEYSRRISTPWDPTTYMYSIPTATNRKHKQKRGLIRSFIAEQIAAAKARLQKTGANSGAVSTQDLLTNILKVSMADEGSFSDEAISDILMTLLFGGYDTTSITLSYSLYLLATHPEIEKKCLTEIETALGSDEHAKEFEGPDKLPYTRAIVLETLRLFPPAPATLRALEKDLELYGTTFKKGTNVFIPIWSIQRDERNFPQPNDIRPDRWVRPSTSTTNDGVSSWEERPSDDTTSSDIAPANRDAFCVFAAGARNCVGQTLALQESVTLLAFLIRKLKFELISEGYQVAPKLCSFVQQPDGGLPMRIKRR